MAYKRFEQTGEIRGFKELTPGMDRPFKLFVDDAGGHTVRQIDGNSQETATILQITRRK